MDVGWRSRWIAVLVCLAGLGRAGADAPPELDLPACLAIAQERQPGLEAWRASLRAAEIRQQALDDIHLPGILYNRDLRARRQQARLGVVIGQAGLLQETHETAYDVTRTYYSVLYARAQLRLVQGVIQDITTYRQTVEDALVKKKVPLADMAHDLISLYLSEARSRELAAQKGIQLAMAALREALGVEDDFCFAVKDEPMPTPRFELCQEQIVELALSRNGEMLEALAAAETFEVEIEAQRRMFLPTTKRTSASSADLHMQEVPLGEHNGDYRPGAVALELPVSMIGARRHRIAWAEALSGRADAVAQKTRNLIRLDATQAFLKWQETSKELGLRNEAAAVGRRLSKRIADNIPGNAQQAAEYLVSHSLVAARAQARYNEALYLYVLALADLERVTAGGFQAGLGMVYEEE